jgi:hypothetical protein
MGVQVRWWLLGSIAALIAVLAFASTAQAANYATPGGGNSYNMSTIDIAAAGAISQDAGPCAFRIHGAITISAGDTLTIDAGCIIRVDQNGNLTIAGRLLVEGNASAPVHFDSSRGAPVEGDWSGITFLGAPFAPSVVDNLSISYSTFGLRCLSCHNLTVRNLLVNLSSGDGVLVRAGSSNLTLWNITDVVTTYALQSVIGVTGGADLSIGPVNGTGVADLLTLWNVTNITVSGPVVGSGLGIAGAWIDNATNVSVAGISGSAFPIGVLVTWSAGVSVLSASLTSPGIAGITATSVDGLLVGQVSITGGAKPALLLFNVTNSTVFNATLSTSGVPLSINQSRALSVGDSALSGGTPASAWINGSSNVTFRNVSVSGGSAGFIIQSSPNVSLLGCSATGAANEGVSAVGSSGLFMDGTRIAGNLGRGLLVVSSPDTRVRNGFVVANQREGVFVSASTLSISDSTVSQNALDGVVVTNGSSLNASNLQLTFNGREGLWLVGGTHLLSGAVVRNNGANGTRIEGATLNLVDGTFENNTGYAIFFAGNASGAWTITGSALIATDDAVLAGSLTADGGQFSAVNGSIQLRGSLFMMSALNAGALWFDREQLTRATLADTYAFDLASGSSLGAAGATFDSPGTPSAAPVHAADSRVDWLAVTVIAPASRIILSNTVATFQDVSVIGALKTVVLCKQTSSLTALRLTLEGGGDSALVLDTCTLDLSQSSILNTSLGLAIDALQSSLTLDGVLIDGAPVGIGADSSSIWVSNLTMRNVGAGISLLNSLTAQISNATVDALSSALTVFAANSLTLVQVDLVSATALAFDAADLGAFAGDGLRASGALGGASLARIGALTLRNFNLTAGAGAGLVLDASPGAALSLGDLGGTTESTVSASEGARLDGLTLWLVSLSIALSNNVTLADSVFHSGGISVANSTGLLFTNLTLTAPSAAAGVLLGSNSSATLRAISVTGGQYGLSGLGGPFLEVYDSAFTGQSAASLMARSYARVVLDNVTAAGAPTGMDLRYIPSLTATTLTVSGSTLNAVTMDRCDNATITGAVLSLMNGTGLRLASSALGEVSGLHVTGGALGINLNASTLLRISNSSVDGALRGLSAGSASSATLVNATFNGGVTSGVVAYNNSTVDVWGSSIAGAPTAPSFHAVESMSLAFVRLYDTPADNATFNRASNGTIEVYWSLTVVVQSGGVGQAGATVSLRDRSGALVASTATDGVGSARFGPVLELRDSQGGRSYASPLSAAASTAGGLAGSRTFDLTAPTTITIDLLDTQPPTLEQRPTPRLPLGGTYTFRVDPTDRDNVGIVRYTWSFSDGTGNPQFAQSTSAPTFLASHVYTVPGLYLGTVTVYDAAGNSASRFFNVSVNDPPYFLHTPTEGSFIGLVGVPVQFDFSASDNDSADVGSLAYTVTGDAGASVLGGFLVFTPAALRNYPFTVTVSDGLNSISYSFVLLVGTPGSGSNLPPEFISPARMDARITDDYLYTVLVRDPEGDDVVIQLLDGPQGMSFTQVLGQPTGQLFWRPSNFYNRTVGEFSANITVSLRAWDGVRSNFAYQNFTLVLKNPPDEPPTMLDFGDFVLGPGEVRRIDLSLYANDTDDDPSTLQWAIVKPDNVEGATIGFDTEDHNVLVIRAPDVIEGTRSFTVQFVVRDPSGLHVARPVGITLKGPTVAEAAFPWLLLLVIVGGVGAAFALATRQRAAALADEAASAARPPGPGGGTSQALAPASDAGFPLYLEGAALFDQSDNILVSATVGGADLDEVFVQLPALARETHGAEGALATARVGGREVAFLRQGDAVLAAIGKFAGDPAPWLEDPMKMVLEQVQARGGELNLDRLEPLADDPAVKEAVRGLLAISAGSSAEAVAKYTREASVRAASVVELVQGLVRLKVAVDNNGTEISADVRLSLEYDDKVLRFDHLEPAVEQRRDKVHLGNLRPGERKTVAYYFDPQICTRSFFNATVSWEDARGGFHSTSMRTRGAEVVCPAFSTAKQANTAMLKRLLQHELAFRDSKYFRFPGETSAEQVFEACKQAVLAQDVRLVREFVTERPFHAEAWFYGETKVKQSPTVIWTAVFGAERVAQFSVASSAHAAITGLLAELGRRLVDSRAGGGIGAPIESMRKAEAAAQVGAKPTLLSKTKSAEADSE